MCNSCLCASVLPTKVNPFSVSQRERGICTGDKVPRRFGFLIQWEQLYEQQCMVAAGPHAQLQAAVRHNV